MYRIQLLVVISITDMMMGCYAARVSASRHDNTVFFESNSMTRSESVANASSMESREAIDSMESEENQTQACRKLKIKVAVGTGNGDFASDFKRYVQGGSVRKAGQVITWSDDLLEKYSGAPWPEIFGVNPWLTLIHSAFSVTSRVAQTTTSPGLMVDIVSDDPPRLVLWAMVQKIIKSKKEMHKVRFSFEGLAEESGTTHLQWIIWDKKTGSSWSDFIAKVEKNAWTRC
jgi:hypothetical protein